VFIEWRQRARSRCEPMAFDDRELWDMSLRDFSLNSVANLCSGSQTEVPFLDCDIRFTPESGIAPFMRTRPNSVGFHRQALQP
jgi:hypothetical protein